ncbi:uncharacterized protein FIBRA_04929 [Fibroporia radiculosa]|uniref:Translational machinery component n=1 Tax=Fibroporia radiculosa TaxID=599839 RepID=J4HWT4_9APHY|nr:uncharacterized protein FIBRA_04929 [Fibroporia radiculosa]CCM02817.1 predicted protein [Fibroporia radiculosa]
MSLLRHSIPHLRAARPCLRSAFMSTEPGPSRGSNAEYFELLSQLGPLSSSSAPTDSGPPTAPEGAYPPPQNTNPVSAVGSYGSDKPMYSIYVKSSRTNTIATLTRPNGNPLKTLTGGKVGFKGGNRSSYEAGYKCAVEIFARLQQEVDMQDLTWQLYLNGFGHGREAVQKALMAEEGNAVRKYLVNIIDKTPIKVGGTRAQKMKRR